MSYSKFQRTCMALHYGWQHAGELAKNNSHSRLWFYHDILHYFFKYGLGSQRYVLYHFEHKSKEEKERSAALFYQKVFAGREETTANRKFIARWSAQKWHTTQRRRQRRNEAYSKYYKTGKNLFVEYGVTIYFYHHTRGTLTIGDNVVISRNSDLDITGDLTLGNKVSISEGAKLLTHNHDFMYKFRSEGDSVENFDIQKGCIKTPLNVQDNVWIGARAVIMPGVTEIGRHAIVGSNCVVKHRIPPYAIVEGNPAKIVGFKCTPEVAAKMEEENYPEENRIPYEVLRANYEKYYNKERRKELWKMINL